MYNHLNTGLVPNLDENCTKVSNQVYLCESDFSIEILDLMTDYSFLEEIQGQSMDTKDQARHVLLVVDIGGLWGKDLEFKMNCLIRVL